MSFNVIRPQGKTRGLLPPPPPTPFRWGFSLEIHLFIADEGWLCSLSWACQAATLDLLCVAEFRLRNTRKAMIACPLWSLCKIDVKHLLLRRQRRLHILIWLDGSVCQPAWQCRLQCVVILDVLSRGRVGEAYWTLLVDANWSHPWPSWWKAPSNLVFLYSRVSLTFVALMAAVAKSNKVKIALISHHCLITADPKGLNWPNECVISSQSHAYLR